MPDSRDILSKLSESDTKKSSEIIVEQKKFDAAQQMKTLKAGTKKICFDYDDQTLILERCQASVKGNGYGKALIRDLVQMSIDKRLNGNVRTDASWSSHIFYLYMGFIPQDKKIPYLQGRHGVAGLSAVSRLAKTDIPDAMDFSTIRRILLREKRITDEIKVTHDVVIQHKEFLLKLLDKEYSTINVFVTNLIGILRKNIDQQFPDTDSLLSVQMNLSQEGKARWLEAIENDIEFKQFKNFEQLNSYMTEDQRAELDTIIEKRSTIVLEKPNDSDDEDSDSEEVKPSTSPSTPHP